MIPADNKTVFRMIFLLKWIGPAAHEIEKGGPRMANGSTRLTNRFYPKKLEMEINPRETKNSRRLGKTWLVVSGPR
jgi:hypothetical protein